METGVELNRDYTKIKLFTLRFTDGKVLFLLTLILRAPLFS